MVSGKMSILSRILGNKAAHFLMRFARSGRFLFRNWNTVHRTLKSGWTQVFKGLASHLCACMLLIQLLIDVKVSMQGVHVRV
jgi:hypothetical protein